MEHAMDAKTAHRIVVGIDGSEASRHALRWAANEAHVRDVELEVVGVWSFPMYLDPMGGAHPLPDLLERSEERERTLLDDEIAYVLGATPAVPIKITLRCGSTAPALLEEAKGSDLLVVGSRGRGGFFSMLLGSTAMHCVQHASVPVAVVRPPRD
jgi:nucleotide-binding universal stress UspA family protein